MTDEERSPFADSAAPAIKEYVVGFLFHNDLRNVVLIRKNRPTWQAGRLNGIGGKIEPGETPAEAMTREFGEETGVLSFEWAWDPLCTITWPNDLARVGDGKAPAVHFFRSVWPIADSTPYVRSMTDEQVEAVSMATIDGRDDLIPNLKWLLPLAAYQADRYAPFLVHATVAETLHPVAQSDGYPAT